MGEQLNQNSPAESASRDIGVPNGFFVQELFERAKIKQTLKDFKEIVDAKKEENLLEIEAVSQQTKEKSMGSVFALNAALNSSDPDQIKLALKDILD